MEIRSIDKNANKPVDDTAPLLKWTKFVARLAAIGATVSGAAVAFFTSSSATSGIAITAAGASTLAAAEKIPNPKDKYLKTKHISPKLAAKLGVKKKPGEEDALTKKEKLEKKKEEMEKKLAAHKARADKRPPQVHVRRAASYETAAQFPDLPTTED